MSLDDERDIQELMRLFQEGDEYAFQRIFNRYKKGIFHYILQMLGKEELAEELTHEAFLKFYQKKEKYNFSTKVSTWLWRIARNTAIDELRKKKEYSLIDPGEVNLLETEGSIEEDLILQAEKRSLQKAMKKLRPSYKEAMALRIYSEKSLKEIGEILEISEGLVKTLLFRGKKELIKIIKKNNQIRQLNKKS